MSQTEVGKPGASTGTAKDAGLVDAAVSGTSSAGEPAPAAVTSTALTPSDPVAGSSLMATSPDESGVDRTPKV